VAEGLAINPNNLSLYELLAKIYLRQDEKKNAIRTYHRLVTMSPENPDYIFNLAELLWQSNQKDNAQKILAQRMLTVGSEDDSTWIRLARFYAQKNEYDLSQNTLIAGLQIHPNSFKLRLALTRMLVNLENYTKAIEWLHPYLLKSQHQTGMQISDAQLLLAKSFLAIGELIKAEQYVDAYLENYPRSRNGHFIKGTIHLLNNDPHSATSEFWSIVEADPLNDMARVELAHAMTRTDQWQEALDILNEGVKQKEDDIILRHALFNIHLRLKNYGQAENQLEKIISKSPEKDQTMILLANFYQTIGAFNKAEDTYKTILSKIPHEVTAHLELSKLYIRERKNKNAINQLKNAHAVIPASEEILTTLVDLYIKQKKYNTAKETINKRLKSDPQNGWLHILLSRIYMAMQQYEKAESQLKTVLHFQPDLVDAHISYMELLYHQQKKDQILFHFQSVIENYPNAIAPQIALAKFYILEKKYSRAIDIYESMVIKDDALFDIARDLVFSLCSHPRDQKDFAKALSLAKKMLSNRPEDAKAIDSVGWAYYHQGNLDRAQGYLHRALNLSPNLFSGLYHLAKVCIDADEVKTAEYALERILTYHGESKEKKDAQKILKNLRSKNRLQR
ncbi:MAG: tetratricopeptide repeat protein, partial [Desulfobacteraceae bacterium]